MSTAFVSPVHPNVLASRQRRRPNLCRVVCVQEQTSSGFGKQAIKSSEPKIDKYSDKFIAWASSKDLQLPNLQLAQFPGPLRGMLVTKRVERGQALISAQPSFVLEVNSLRSRSPFPDKVPDTAWNALAWYGRLALKLLLKRNEDEWKPWISLLPKIIDTPLHWRNAELDELQSKRFKSDILKQRGAYREMFDKLATKTSFARSVRYEDFEWALDCVLSRAFEGPLEVAPFKERAKLFLFVLANTIGFPLLGIFDWNQAVNGKYLAFYSRQLVLT